MEENTTKQMVPYPTSYYLKVFKQLDETNQCEFNWSAAIFGPFWALYRKIYLGALPILISVPINVIFAFDFLVVVYKFMQRISGQGISAYKMAKELNCFFYIGGAFLIYQIVSILLYGKYGNKLYYKQIKKKISQGYHQVENISATISPFVIVLILVSLPILSSYAHYVCIELLKILKISYDGDWKSVCLIMTMVFTLILIMNSAFDALVVKKFKKSHEITNTKISEDNVIKYLTLDGSNSYLKILNTILFIAVCGFLCIIHMLINYTC